ncbi:MAG: type II toxin-antitoxin system VapC family toxin [Propionibacteriaceae bacterium]|nr:type II toxin-antitoxin system VapC family toxin [Propionibacteriaceae bacterium]
MTSAERWAVDTSVAVAALDSGHTAHGACLTAVQDNRPALAGHAAFEVFSVLTRMPGAIRVDPTDAATLMQRVFPHLAWLSPDGHTQLLPRLAVVGISGGAVYDALVGAAAHEAGRTLLTRDRRAQRTYDLLGVAYQMVGP